KSSSRTSATDPLCSTTPSESMESSFHRTGGGGMNERRGTASDDARGGGRPARAEPGVGRGQPAEDDRDEADHERDHAEAEDAEHGERGQHRQHDAGPVPAAAEE